MNILNHIQVLDNLHTSGQPNPEEFEQIRDAGVATVMNLAMPDSNGALENEAHLVTSFGMNYVHIPVQWENPQEEQFELFRSILTKQLPRKIVWVHCAMNWRVSSFVYLFKINELGIDRQAAYSDLLKVWSPNDVWEQFIKRLAV